MSTKNERLEALARQGIALLQERGFYAQKARRLMLPASAAFALEIAETDRQERITQALRAVWRTRPNIDAMQAAEDVLRYDRSLLKAQGGPPTGEELRAFIAEVKDAAKKASLNLTEPKAVPLPSIAMSVGAGVTSTERIKEVVNQQIKNAGAGRFRA